MHSVSNGTDLPVGSGEGSARPSNADTVMVAQAPSSRVLFSSVRPSEVVGRLLSELDQDFELFHHDGRSYELSEWPLARTIESGEVVVEEERFSATGDARRRLRCSSYPVYDHGGELVAGVMVTRDVTDLASIEEQVAYHASLLENVEDAVVGTDPQFRLTVWNAGAERLYGFAAEEVLGRDARSVGSYPADTSRVELERELLEGDRIRTELTACRKDGAVVEVELISVAVRDDHGEITAYLGIHRDITERKRADEALRAERARTRSVLESVTDAVFAVDRADRVSYLNHRALRVFNDIRGESLAEERLIGCDIWELFPELVGTRLHAQYQLAVGDRRTIILEHLHPPDGPWLEIRLYPSADGMAVYFRDVSDRHAAALDLERRVDRQQALADLGLRALSAGDGQSLLEDACEMVARTLDVARVTVAELLPGGDEVCLRAGVGWQPGTIGAVRRPAGPGSLVGYTVAAGRPVISDDVTADDRFTIGATLAQHRVASAMTVVIAGREKPFGALGVFCPQQRSFSDDDASFLQAVANVLAAAVERSQGDERLREVREEERRRIARALHDEALQAVTDALAGAGHDDPETEQPDQVVAALKGVSEQLRSAIYDLRLGDDEDRSLAELLVGLVAVHRGIAKAIDIDLEVGRDVPTLPLGPTGTEVLRIAGEALTNARRHADAGHVSVRVSQGADLICAEVCDDGCGFDAAAALSAPGGGITGMRERAELLGGRLAIRSSPEAGTTVRLEFPSPTEPRRAGRAVRVLLVEDHVAVAEAIATSFEREGDLRVVGHAGSLARARTMLAGVDVMLLDLTLPDGYGGDLIEELRAVSPHAQTLVLSATVDRVALARAVERGAAGILDKTARLDDVVGAVRRLRAGETLMPADEVVELLRFARLENEREHRDRQVLDRLTPREREVLQLVSLGLDRQEIAGRLHISVSTQRNHVANILGKLELHSQLQAVLFAARYDVVKLS